MKKLLINVLAVALFGIFVLHQFNVSVLSLFSSSEEELELRCVKFETKDKTLLELVNTVNHKRDSQRELLGLKCTYTSTISLDVSKASPPSASTVWSLYQDLNYDYPALENFTNFFFLNKIGEENIKKILTEIYNWTDDPRMDEQTKNRIIGAFEKKP